MAIFRCKMCGGDLNVTEGISVIECEYCGSKQTVPSADNEKKVTLFGRANRLLLSCEFDKAFGVFESIVSEFPEEAEAYWGLILCKYGIEYVDDPATGKKIPTCHRSSFSSVMEDGDFEQVMENADVVARTVYREEAKKIEELRKGIIEVSAKEEPYDIFICYKETAPDGNRTLDSVIAQDVYTALTEKGYRVFFSRISLEDKLGVAYEPYIFAALNSAKIMLAFGTDYEYYNAVWVKNEWSRFLQLIAKGEKKTLIPCYKNIDAYDMPKEFTRLQAQDMGKVGAIQDLLRGIEKILPKTFVKQTIAQPHIQEPSTAVAESPEEARISKLFTKEHYKLKDDGTIAIIRCPDQLSKEEIVILPSKIQGLPVSEISGMAFFGTQIQAIVIPEGIVEIGRCAFRGAHMTSVSIPTTAKRIGVSAFGICRNLVCVKMPEGVEYIEERAFEECKKLTSIKLPNTLISIGNFAFNDCCSIQNIVIPSRAIVGEGVFLHCHALKSITVSNDNSTYTSMQGHLYSKDKTTLISFAPEGVRSFEVPEHVKTIAPFAISGQELESIKIPATLKKIKRSGISSSPKLTTIDVCESSPFFKSIDGVLYTKDGSEIIAYPAGRSETQFIIPDTVMNIRSHAFEKCANLTSIIISKGVSSIEEKAFAGCTNLSSIAISESVSSIGERAFMECTNLSSIAIPKSVSVIEKGAFQDCEKLKTISIPSGVKNLEEYTFCGCQNLISITLPNTITHIGDSAFSNCENLTSITLPSGLTQIEECAFYDCKKLKEISIPKNVSTIGTEAFYGCEDLCTVQINGSVSNVGQLIFYQCNNLSTVYLLDQQEAERYDCFPEAAKIISIKDKEKEEQQRLKKQEEEKEEQQRLKKQEEEKKKKKKEQQLLKKQEEKRKRAAALAEQKKLEELQSSRRAQGVCQHCGGQFKGWFSKTCVACGKKRDY